MSKKIYFCILEIPYMTNITKNLYQTPLAFYAASGAHPLWFWIPNRTWLCLEIHSARFSKKMAPPSPNQLDHHPTPWSMALDSALCDRVMHSASGRCWKVRPLFTLKVRCLFLLLLKMKVIHSLTTHSLIYWFHLNLLWILSIKPSMSASKTAFIYNCLKADLIWDKELPRWWKSILYKENSLKHQWKTSASLLTVVIWVRGCLKLFNKIKI